jgi:hypothetical protein
MIEFQRISWIGHKKAATTLDVYLQLRVDTEKIRADPAYLADNCHKSP